MINREELTSQYLGWIEQLVIHPGSYGNYKLLLKKLHNTPFLPLFSGDENRIENGKNLRYKFLYEHGIPYNIGIYISPDFCSILEVMVNLAVICEEEYMSDPQYGDRTFFWFQDMLKSMDLTVMTNDNFDENYVNAIIRRFEDRTYLSNGHGSMFCLENQNGIDMREWDIWHQFCFYVNELIAKGG